MNIDLYKRIAKQITDYQYSHNRVWGNVKIKVSKEELTQTVNFLKSKNWYIKEIHVDFIVINHTKRSYVRLYD